MQRLAVRLAAAALLLLAAACAPVHVRPTQALLAAQAAREDAFPGHGRWTIEGRLGVSDGHDGGSGTLTWLQDGASYDFIVRAPVTGRSFRLHGDAGAAVLEGLDQGPLRGSDPRTLLARALGWRVPLDQLRFWVRGLRAPGSEAELEFGANGLPATLLQDGWNIEYKDWYGTQPPLPRKVFASSGPFRVRLAIRTWKLGVAAMP
ncbi:MAG TPA: lipoprotein insertase outer membrane protein LolB [Rhodanobacteraceae bacterium]|nr:lipoprotein insertase outer membrane protein LolB [Rhodanobacteraceae bacterium]